MPNERVWINVAMNHKRVATNPAQIALKLRYTIASWMRARRAAAA
jgi:hypothetical protein